MDFVKIRGKDLPDCIMQMKTKYGPDAHFYDHRFVTEGGWLGTGLFANRICELNIGIPEKQASRDRIEKKLKDLKELLKEKQRTPRDYSSERTEKQYISPKTLDSIRPFSERRRKRLNSEPISTLEPILIDEAEAEEELGMSLASLPELRREVSKEEPRETDNTPKVHPNLVRFQEKLISEGMSATYANGILLELQNQLAPADLSRYQSICEKAVAILEQHISVDFDLFSGTPRGKRKVVFFSGPTGSGKTTSIAKLAAKYSLHMGKKVSLYTTDNYRIAAVDQLRFYAEAMDMEFQAPKDPRKFREAILRDGAELILVDTAGYSHRNPENLLRLREYFQALSDKDYLENILVMSSTISKTNAWSVAEAYEELGYKRILLTKLDEAEFLGSFLELADTKGREFAFVSVGQDVPFDILNATKKLLAETVIFPEKLRGIAGEVFEKAT